MSDFPAFALLEFDSIALGMLAGDAMVKQSPVAQLMSGTVQPGRYLVMVAGAVAEVDEAVKAGRAVGETAVCDAFFLPNIHPDVVQAIKGERMAVIGEAMGIIETHTVAAAIEAADAGMKGAEVSLWQLRLGDGLGGKGLLLFRGLVSNVEAAIEIAAAQAGTQLYQQVIISQIHQEMAQNVAMSGRFGDHFNWSPS